MTPPLYDSNDVCRERLGVGGWLWRTNGLDDIVSSRIEFERVATPGFCITERLRTGTYIERSELALLIGVLSAFAGFELFQVVSVTTVILFSDMAVACSKTGSSVRFSKRFAS